MKKFSIYVMAIIIAGLSLTSCKKEVPQQVTAQTESKTETSDLSGRHNQCCSLEPPTITGGSRLLTPVGSSQNEIYLDYGYTNPAVNGASFRCVLQKADGTSNEVSIQPAFQGTIQDLEILHLVYTVANSAFPCTLKIIGRPANLQCPQRSNYNMTFAL